MRRRLLGLGLVSLVGLAGCNFSRANAKTDARVAGQPGEASLSSPDPAPVQREQPAPVAKIRATQAPETKAQETKTQAAEETARLGPAVPVSPAAPGGLSSGVSSAGSSGSPSSRLDTANSVAESGALHQDYGPATPLPATGQVTIRSDIRDLDPNRLIAPCPSDSSPYAFAESTNYRVQICSAEYDPWQPKYYIGQAKQGNEELQITSTDPAAARQLIFNHAGYTYVLYRDGRGAASGEAANAYLQVFTPSGEGYAEALLYFYETSPLRMPQ